MYSVGIKRTKHAHIPEKRTAYDRGDFFEVINQTLTSTTDLRSLLERVSDKLALMLGASHVSFFISRPDGRFVSSGTTSHPRIPRQDIMAIDSESIQLPMLQISQLPSESLLRRLLLSYRIELVLPLVRRGIPLGYLFIGQHTTAEYSRQTLELVQIMTDELSIAVQNALSIEEIRELNASLTQRIDTATRELRASNAQLQRLDAAKDEFVSMASHQLRTPLTSVKGYISMVLEGDAGAITPAQKHLLSEAFTSSERMVHLISDFLNVSRLQTGKFLIDKRPVNLAILVEQELDSLATTAKSRNLSFSYRVPAHFPVLNLDEGKFRQVIMNIADNALYYSRENTVIHVHLASTENEAMFTVKDTGIGVPKAEQSQLFTKFYRASNARKQRPDGTGVGLFLAKKVIDAHGGKVIVESLEGKGSTFGFRLPIAPLRVSDTDQLGNQPHN